MKDRFIAEEELRALCGGEEPKIGDTIVYTRNGWKFRQIVTPETLAEEEEGPSP